MPIPVADAIALLQANAKERVEKLVEQIDSSISNMYSFPLSVGFSRKEDREVLKLVAEEYKATGYNVFLRTNSAASETGNAFIMYLNHGKPYDEKGSHVLFTC